MTLRQIGLVALASLSLCLSSVGLCASPKPSIVLVHGALIDGSSWRGVHRILTGKGYRVRVVQHPLSDLEADVAATRRVLDLIDGPIVLVGNSYGGAIITVAGADPKVKALVYVAALIPDVGESTSEIAPPNPSLSEDFVGTRDGYVFLDPASFALTFGPDLSKRDARFMADAQMPVAMAAFEAKLPAAAWHNKRSFFVLATEDSILDPAVASWMARRAGAQITRVRGSHAILITNARAVARVIDTAANAVR
jgi:pimeloyl-ACP methyl ester carboxylesterase